jgi:hypothetical protein
VKNRPGQRARQARHQLKEARKEAKERKSGAKPPVDDQAHLPPSQRGTKAATWGNKGSADRAASRDAPRGTSRVAWQGPSTSRSSASVKRPHDSGHNWPHNASAASDVANEAKKAKKGEKKGENAIHGSWEAAKLRREKEAAIMFAAKPAGKKIVFGE